MWMRQSFGGGNLRNLPETLLRNELSTRERYLMLAAAAWGAALGALPGGQFTSVLLGPPIAYLFLRKRPLLSWQIPIIASAMTMALKERGPQGPYTEGSVLPVILLIWVVESLFSAPWPYIFQRRMQKDRKEPATLVRTAKMSFGVGFLVFLACGFIVLGFAALARGVAGSSGQDNMLDQSAPFLIVTIGIGLALYICRGTKKLNLNKEVESLFGWLLALVVLTAVPMVFIDVYQGKFHCPQSSADCTQLSPPLEVFLGCVASVEAIAALIWLLRRGRRAMPRDGSVVVRSST